MGLGLLTGKETAGEEGLLKWNPLFGITTLGEGWGKGLFGLMGFEGVFEARAKQALAWLMKDNRWDSGPSASLTISPSPRPCKSIKPRTFEAFSWSRVKSLCNSVLVTCNSSMEAVSVCVCVCVFFRVVLKSERAHKTKRVLVREKCDRRGRDRVLSSS